MTTEHRTFHNVEVRAAGTGPNGRPLIEVQLIKPYVVDDYGSVWMPDVFDRQVGARIAADPDDTPSLCWSHDWTDPIGHGITFTPGPDGPRFTFELDEFDAVPRAKQADAQVRSKTIRDTSVGFSSVTRRDPTPDEMVKWPGVREVITDADLDEDSLVLRGAVPGAKVLAVRSARTGEMIEVDGVVAIAAKVAAGEIDQATADEALRLMSGPAAATPPVESTDGTATGDGSGEALPEIDAVLAEADDVLAAVADRSR